MPATSRRQIAGAALAAALLAATGCASDEIRPPFVEEKAAPDGAITGRIVVTTRGDVEHALAELDPAGEELEDLDEAEAMKSPAFSPDGGRLAAAYNVNGRGGIAVLAGATRQTVVEAAGYFDHPTWSPDGTRLAYAHQPVDGTWDVHVIDLATMQSTTLVAGPAQDWYPSWSPDGARIAFTSDRDGDNAIWVADAGSGRATKLVDSEGEDAEPSWSPDGDTVVFTSDRELDTWQIHTVPAAGGEDERLVRSDTVDRYPVYSPDGRYILVSTGYLAVYAADGGRLPNRADRWKLADELTFAATWTAIRS